MKSNMAFALLRSIVLSRPLFLGSTSGLTYAKEYIVIPAPHISKPQIKSVFYTLSLRAGGSHNLYTNIGGNNHVPNYWLVDLLSGVGTDQYISMLREKNYVCLPYFCKAS